MIRVAVVCAVCVYYLSLWPQYYTSETQEVVTTLNSAIVEYLTYHHPIWITLLLRMNTTTHVLDCSAYIPWLKTFPTWLIDKPTLTLLPLLKPHNTYAWNSTTEHSTITTKHFRSQFIEHHFHVAAQRSYFHFIPADIEFFHCN